MTVVTATSVLALPKNTLADMLSRSSTFQTETGAADATAAWEFIHLTHWVLEDSATPEAGPWAIVYLDDGYAMRKDSGGERWDWTSAGALMVYMRTPKPFGYADIEAQSVAAENFVGGVMQDLFNLSAIGSSNLTIQEIELTTVPQRIAPWQLVRRRSKFWESEIRVTWGPG